MLLHMPVSRAAKDMWDEIDRIERRRNRIFVGLREQGGIPDRVKYRHHLDDASLAHYGVDVEDKSVEQPTAFKRNEGA